MGSPDLHLPAWLTEDYLQSRLRAFHADPQLKVLRLSANAASAKGENYVGVVTRILVEFEPSGGAVVRDAFLLKQACPDDAPEAGIFAEYGVYGREMDMYEFILPRMQRLLREAGVGAKLCADAICIDRVHGALLLQDLSQLRYRNADRVKQLDMEHTRLTLQMLAQFHGSAMVLMRRQPALLGQGFAVSFFSRGFKGYAMVFGSLFKGLLRFVQTQPQLEARYYAKLQRLAANLMEYTARSFDVCDDELRTLSHGDCWTTNIMFQYDAKGQPTAVVPIDFQFSTVTSPLTDLHYFFSTSLQESVKAREPELVQYYYYELKKVLAQLNYEAELPSLLNIQVEFERRKFLSVVIALVFQPLMIYTGNKNPSFANLFQDSPEAIIFQDSLYESERAREIVAQLLPVFDAKGLLDEQ